MNDDLFPPPYNPEDHPFKDRIAIAKAYNLDLVHDEEKIDFIIKFANDMELTLLLQEKLKEMLDYYTMTPKPEHIPLLMQRLEMLTRGKFDW